jgi:Holliday junction resolvasome RuvABC endonuclease subunit
MTKVLGFDLAAERSGVALPDGTTLAITAPKVRGRRTLADDLDRIDHIESRVQDVLVLHRPRLAVIEDYAAGLHSSAAHRLAEISGVVRLACYRAGIGVALVNPMHLKTYATGSSKATKSQMATAAQGRAGLVFPTEDECDAWWLRAMGLDHLGAPIVDLPKTHRAALDKVTWPEAVTA